MSTFGYGDGSGDGYGHGSGDGYGHGSGDGYGYSKGDQDERQASRTQIPPPQTTSSASLEDST